MDALRRSEDVEAHGTSLSGPAQEGIHHTDLTDFDSVVSLLDEVRPETIYHLAAFASPGLSLKKPVEAVTSTLAMQINIYQACLTLGFKPRILVVSTGQIYGMAVRRRCRWQRRRLWTSPVLIRWPRRARRIWLRCMPSSVSNP
jgi:GDP-4-dehydro-6-deoxy-D-mannose reductase